MHSGVPVPSRPANRPRASRSSDPAPIVDCGRYPRQAHASATTVDVARRHLPRRPRRPARRRPLPGRPATRRWREAPLRRIDADGGGDRWAGAFAVDALGPLGVGGRGVDRPLRLLARRAAAQGRGRPGGPRAASCREGALLLRDAAARAKGDRRGARAPTAVPTPRPTAPRVDAALEPELADAVERHPDRHEAARLAAPARRRRRPRAAPASAPGTSSSRAPGAACAASRSRSRGSPSWASTSSTCRRSTRSATRTARARNNTLRRRPGRPRQPVGDRPPRASAATTRSTPTSARSRTSTRSWPPAREHGIDDRAGLRDPVLGRPPVADRAPRVVQPPPRRHAEVRREPAQEVPGHLQRQLGHARTGAGCGRRCCDVVRYWVDHGVHGVPRRQPAHQAARRSGSG